MKLSLNLATRSYVNRRALYAIYAFLVALLVFLLVLNIGNYFRSRSQARQLETRLSEFDRELADHREVPSGFSPEAYERMLGDIVFANEILVKDSFRWTALLDRLEEVVPGKVLIRGIQPDYTAGSLNLTARAKRIADLSRFLDNLIQSPDFRDVYLLQQAREKGEKGGPGDIGFSVVVKEAF